MSEKIRNCSVAYSKGVREASKTHSNKNTCPYGETKRELQYWWIAGFNDKKNNNVDTSMCIDI